MDRRLHDGLHSLTNGSEGGQIRNPLRSEAEAFRFLIVAIVGAVIVVAAANVNAWVGVAAAVLVVGGVCAWVLGGPPRL